MDRYQQVAEAPPWRSAVRAALTIACNAATEFAAAAPGGELIGDPS